MSKVINKEIDPEQVWINISKGKMVRAAVLTGCGVICMGVYNLKNEIIGYVNDMIDLAKEGENIRFYVLEKIEEDNNDVTG